jgi:hypothetical protein
MSDFGVTKRYFQFCISDFRSRQGGGGGVSTGGEIESQFW